MDDRERQQAQLIVDQELHLFRSNVEARIGSVFADHSARGRLHSEATVRVSVRGMGELAESLLDALKTKLVTLAPDDEAFVVLFQGDDGLDFCERQLVPVARMASGRLQGPITPSTSDASAELFRQVAGKHQS